MSDTAGRPKKKHRWLRRIVWGIASVVVVLVIARVVAGIVTRHQFDARVRALREAHVPVTLAEMAPPVVPDNENAAPLYMQAFARFDLMTRAQLERIGFLGRKIEPLSDDELSDARELLAEAAGTVDLLTSGSLRPVCRYDVNYGADPFRLRLPHLDKLRLGVALLRLAAEQDAAEGRPYAAFAHASCALRLARSTRDEPMLVSMLVDLGASSSALREVEIELDRWETSDATLAELDRAIGPAMGRERLIRAIRAERTSGIEVMRLVMHDPNAVATYTRGGESGPFFRFWVSMGVTLAEPLVVVDGLRYLDLMDALERLAAEPYRSGGAEWAKVNHVNENLAYRYSITHPFMRVMVPAVPRMMRVFDYGIARAGEARIAVALRRWRLAHGTYPETLDVLAPGLLADAPVDPFSGRAFHYRREGGGFVLYSIGANARDESGVNADTTGGPDDVTWRCSR